MSKYKLCAKCEEEKPPESGIFLSPFKWICQVCWLSLTTIKIKPVKQFVPKNIAGDQVELINPPTNP
jgi:hypothetical protein